MLRFFRKIRQNLFQEKKIGRYLVYAFGEVALVIIGIMIAVSLNNLNETKKQDKKIQATLRQVQSELTNTIEASKSVIEFYRVKDSLIYVFLNNELTKDDLSNPKNAALLRISNNYNALLIQDDGFINLMLQSERLTEKYDSLSIYLKNVYGRYKDNLEVFIELTRETALETINYQKDNYAWYTDVGFKGETPDEFLNYVLNDKHYKNSLTKYSIIAMSNFIPSLIQLRVSSIALVRRIDIQLGEKNKHAFEVNGNDYAYWNGKYHYQGDTIQFDNDEMGVKWFNDGEWQEVYPLGNDVFHSVSAMFSRFKKDESGQINGIRFHSINTNLLYEKIQEND